MISLSASSQVRHPVEIARPLTIGVACAAAIGTFLRVDGAGSKDLWLDEVLAAWRISAPSSDALLDALKGSPFPPLYYLALRCWVGFCGQGNLSLRSLSLAAGLAALPATYLVWRGLIGQRAACWTTALLSLNYYHINYSQDAKMYAAIWLLAIVSSGAFLRSVLRGGGRCWLVLFGVCNALLPLVSYVGLVPLVVEALFLAWIYSARPARRQSALMVGMTGALALLPSLFWLPFALPAAVNRVGITWIPPARWIQLPGDLYSLIGIHLTGYEVRWAPPFGPASIGLIACQVACIVSVACLLASGAVAASRGQQINRLDGSTILWGQHSSEVVVYLALWLFLPVLGSLAFSMAVYSVWGVPRYMAGAAPALLVSIGMAIELCPRKQFARLLALSVLAANLVTIGFDRTHATRAPWDEVARTVETVGAAMRMALASRIGAMSDETRLAVVVGNDLDPVFLQERCLEYALARRDVSSRQVLPFFIPFGDAIRQEGPFVAIELAALDGYGHDPIGIGIRQLESEGHQDEIVLKLIFYQTIYARDDGLPGPFSPRALRVWICTRSDRGPSHASALSPPPSSNSIFGP